MGKELPTGSSQEYYSKVFDDTILITAMTGRHMIKNPKNLVEYTEKEVGMLRAKVLTPDDLRLIHEVKKSFPGSKIVHTIPRIEYGDTDWKPEPQRAERSSTSTSPSDWWTDSNAKKESLEKKLRKTQAASSKRDSIYGSQRRKGRKGDKHEDTLSSQTTRGIFRD